MIPTLLMMVFTAMGSGKPIPFYRYYNGYRIDHFYTTDWKELGNGNHGWAYQGIECRIYSSQVPDTVPLYRYWHKKKSDHFYTTNIKEIGTATHGRFGWGAYLSEGIAGYCYSKDQGSETFPLHRFYDKQGRNHFYTTNIIIKEELEGAKRYRYEGIECYVPVW